MTDQLLIALTNSVLGQGKQTSRGNYAYHCQNCNHPKPKLEINFDSTSENFQSYSCWVCGIKGKKLTTLFKKFNIHQEKQSELRSLLKINTHTPQEYQPNPQPIQLPKEFKPIHSASHNNIIVKHATHYLKKRGLTPNDIIKYNIGYCESGEYNNMIIIPSYDELGKLNFFVGRDFTGNSSIKYKNPKFSKNIIPFELFINWDLPLIICEGPFDAMAIKRNVIPLLGKNIQPNLMKKIISSRVKKVYIALDRDAITRALEFCEQLLNENKEVYLVEMDGKDPSAMGFKHFFELIHDVQPLTFNMLFEKKLQNI
jgi:DNA primase